LPDEATTKQAPGTRRLVGYLCALLLVGAAILAFTQMRSNEPPPAGSGYYRGPMLNKAGTHYVTAEGKIVPPPPGAPPIKPRGESALAPKGQQ
jgi:hypothetical protein